jgi:hypothetical protein
MDPLAQKAVDICKKHGKALAAELVSEAIEPALDALVKQTATPIDDVLAAALKAPLKAAILDYLNKL